MITSPMNHNSFKGARRIFLGAIALAAAFSLAACTSQGTAATNGASKQSVPQLAGYSTVPAPGPSVDVSSLKGKTIYWIPITSQAPVFSIEQAAATAAFAAAGVKLQLCDGQASPAAVAACVNQAVAAKAAGIIATSIPPEFAEQSFSSAIAARVPIEFVNTKDATVPAQWGKLAAALPANFVQQAQLNGRIIIKDSAGKASVLLIEVTDSSVTTSAYDVGMKGYLTKMCPGCTLSTIQVGSTTLSNLSAQVSAALVKEPSTNYVFVEFDSFAAPVVQAVRQLNKAGSVKILSMLGQLDGMKRIADGSSFADTGYSIAALGWNEADVLFRLMLGKDPAIAGHRTPIKTYTSANISGVDLTEAGWKSGKWSSNDDFRAMYKKLWELN
jgi:ribose transport system substrate-binding protein